MSRPRAKYIRTDPITPEEQAERAAVRDLFRTETPRDLDAEAEAAGTTIPADPNTDPAA